MGAWRRPSRLVSKLVTEQALWLGLGHCKGLSPNLPPTPAALPHAARRWLRIGQERLIAVSLGPGFPRVQ